MSNYVYNHLRAAVNKGGGLSDSVLFAPVYDFSTIGCPPATGSAPGDLVTVVTDHAFLTGKGFLEAFCAPFKNTLKATTVGELGATKLEQKLEVMFQGSYAELHEAMAFLKDTPLIVLIKDANCAADLWYQLGCDCLFTYAAVEFDSADVKGSGIKGYKVTFTYYADAVVIYGGTVTKKP